MLLSEAKKLIIYKGFTYNNVSLSFMPPNTLVYKHPDGRYAHLDEMDDGRIIVEGLDISNIETLSFFRRIIESKTNPS